MPSTAVLGSFIDLQAPCWRCAPPTDAAPLVSRPTLAFVAPTSGRPMVHQFQVSAIAAAVGAQ